MRTVYKKMSFSGVFRYSKNGYNVPAKPEGKQVNFLNIEDEYNKILCWKNLES